MGLSVESHLSVTRGPKFLPESLAVSSVFTGRAGLLGFQVLQEADVYSDWTSLDSHPLCSIPLCSIFVTICFRAVSLGMT